MTLFDEAATVPDPMQNIYIAVLVVVPDFVPWHDVVRAIERLRLTLSAPMPPEASINGIAITEAEWQAARERLITIPPPWGA